MSTSPLSGFAVSTGFVGDRVVIGVRGEVGLVTAPELAGILDAVIDGGHRSVVLDLAELGSMDAPGVGVIARGARRLAPAGELTVRSPPAMLRRELDLTGLATVVRLEHPEPRPGSPDPRPGSPAEPCPTV